MAKPDLVVAYRAHRALDLDLSDEALEQVLATVVEIAKASSPSLAIDDLDFVGFLGRTERGRSLVAAGRPEPARVAELALAWACDRGDAGAHALFDARYVQPLGDRLRSIALDAAALDDVKQDVRDKLLARKDGELVLASYAGQGRLEGLVQVVATRAAVDAIRKRRREVSGDDALTIEAPDDDDPERRALARRYRPDIVASIEAAARSLEPRDRSLLRLHLVGGVTLDRLAEMYGVHRATIVRWLARARASMLAETKKDLARRVGANVSEVESLMGVVESRLDLSVERILASTDAD